MKPARLAHRGDRTVRGLHNIHGSASTARVMNLTALAAAMKKTVDRGDYAERPMFLSPILNTSLVIKHKLRAGEHEMFEDGRSVATKIILPFSIKDLKLGGQSIFIGARGWEDFLATVCPDAAALTRDQDVCELLDRAPSLDPFLLREYLQQNGIEVSERYFVFSSADAQRMQKFVTGQVKLLVSLATRQSTVEGAKSTARMVEALLANSIDERLEPLRESMRLDGLTFREGVFSWRGFLYYKWKLSELEAELAGVIGEINQLQLVGSVAAEDSQAVRADRDVIRRSLAIELQAVRAALGTYDDAFHDLTRNGNPVAFRRFLMDAPDMFVTLGEKMGAISHITSFWRYRFPPLSPLRIPAPEARDLMSDFRASLCVRI